MPSANGNSNSSSTVPNSFEVGANVHQGTIKSIVWTPTSPNVLITASDDSKVRWWDLRSRNVITTHDVDGPIGSCELNTTSMATPHHTDASAEGLLSIAAGKSVYFFDGSSSRPGVLLKKHKLQQDVASVALNIPERKFVTGGGGDTWVRVYDLDTAEELEVGKGHHGPVWSVCFSPDGRLYATGSEDGTVKLWKFTSGQYGLWR